MWIALPVLDEIVDRTLREDLGAGDLTSEATVSDGARAVATAVARSSLVVCGGDVFRRVFERLEPAVLFEELVADGARVDKGASLWRVRGSARALLMAERSALNLVQRMSGTATAARTYVEALPEGTTTRVTDTRKTTPGLRVLERYAVRCGGAYNHRDSLGTAVMIKDNHIVAAGGIAPAVARARARAPHLSRVEVEVASLDELAQALAAGADVIMLDNFTPTELAEAVRRAKAKGNALLEASGGITLETLASYARTGVDVISIGALTHSARAADIALDLTLALGVRCDASPAPSSSPRSSSRARAGTGTPSRWAARATKTAPPASPASPSRRPRARRASRGGRRASALLHAKSTRTATASPRRAARRPRA